MASVCTGGGVCGSCRHADRPFSPDARLAAVPRFADFGCAFPRLVESALAGSAWLLTKCPSSLRGARGQPMKPGHWLFLSAVIAAGGLAACGGSDSPAPAPAPAPAPVPAPPPPPPVVLPPLVTDAPVLISAASPFPAGCTGVAGAGAPYTNAEVEPHVAVNPRDPANIVAVWQQDRWASRSANGLMTATTTNGGVNWTRVAVPFSRCAGGTVANGGDYARSTDPWVTIAPDGTAFQMAL